MAGLRAGANSIRVEADLGFDMTTVAPLAPVSSNSQEFALMSRVAAKRMRISTAVENAADQGRLAELTVGDVMTASPTSVAAETSAIQLVQLFQQNRYRHLLVTEGTHLLGVVSDRDVLRLMGQEDFQDREQWDQITAQDLMCQRPAIATADMPLVEAVQTIAERGISCLPVIRGGDELVGIVTATDLYLALEQVLAALATQPA